MIPLPTSTPSAFSGATLLSGALGALLASVISLVASYLIDMRNKAWTLKAELRRHRVGRLVTANDGLRTCYYAAQTELRYHRLALGDIEVDGNRPGLTEADRRHWEDRYLGEIQRYNSQMSRVEATAMGHAGFLADGDLPASIIGPLQKALEQLVSSHTSTSTSVQVRIDFFEQMKPEVMGLLKEIDALISAQIASSD